IRDFHVTGVQTCALPILAMAVTAFKKKEVDKIVLTRPAVEAGEKLGFLPGDLQHKVDPYLRPLYDSLYEMMGFDAYQNYLEKGRSEEHTSELQSRENLVC